jgi:prepilin-type N-terminal cleavage/methylation domain-containing protein
MSKSRIKSVVCGLRSVVCRRQAAVGFTLIELLVAMAILMVIVLMLSNLFQQSTRAWSTGMQQTTIGLEARAVLNMIQKDVSMALPDPAPQGNAGSLTLHILDENGVPQQVSYTSGGGQVTRNGRVVAVNVSDFTFQLLQADPEGVDPFADMVEIRVVLGGETRVSTVRVYADGRAWGEPERETDVVDTHRGP